MGDRTFYRLALPANLSAEQMTLAATAFDATWNPDDPVKGTHAQIGRGHVIWIDDEQRTIGECQEIADSVLAALHEAGHTEVPFTVTEDPWWPSLGTMCRYLPPLGMHQVDCDGHGQPVLTQAAYQAIASRSRSRAAIASAMHAHYGTDWQAAPCAQCQCGAESHCRGKDHE